MDSVATKKRPASEEASGVSKKPMTKADTSLTQPEKDHTDIYYLSSVENKENMPQACIDKMVDEAPTLRLYPEENIAANMAGFSLFREIRQLRQEIADARAESADARAETAKVAAQQAESNDLLQDFRVSHLDVRQRTYSTWVRDALGKNTPSRTAAIQSLNKDVVHAGDIRFDAMLVTERFTKSSTERQHFSALYGLTAEDVNALEHKKCRGSLRALNRAASILFDKSKKSLETGMEEERKKLVDLLLKGEYEEAEKLSGTVLCGK
ncbi:hypothetical protein PEBR_21857 [Penicillium brasilianum]|uniref:Uncharacterized protein n=1 Tax=Penicillium brasilianum TaxID=104259 RepID=A0A1S9RLY1_PENBI|nr:hypothetical protein PEBR_21857 [Penicillium brasilianum]